MPYSRRHHPWTSIAAALLLAFARGVQAAPCPGDCDGDGVVSAAEIAQGVDAAVTSAGAPPCEALDADGDARVTARDLVAAVVRAQRGCLLADCAFPAGALASQTLPPTTPTGYAIPIDRVVVLMQENRSFDHYFGTLPAEGHVEVQGPPPGTFNPDANGLPVFPYHEERACMPDVDHSWNGSHREWNGGRNDGFVVVNDPEGERAMAVFDKTDLPFYHALARSFAMADRYHASLLGPTFPNRFYLYTGTSFGHVANDVSLVGYTQRTIFDALTDAGVSWRIYYSDIAFGRSFRRLRGTPNVVSLDQYFADAQAGTLPAVAFVDPAFTTTSGPQTDEHPPRNLQVGQAFVASVINALLASPNWASSALFLTYDEHGGFFDHVPPPTACVPDAIPPMLDPGDEPGAFDRLGFRVPFVAVSPWARPGYVSHRIHDHASILRFIETRFDLPALTARDANALPLLDLFDFTAPALLTPPPLPEAVVDPDRQARCTADGF